LEKATRIALAAVILIASISSALAADRVSLPGFQKYLFATTEADLRKAVPIVKSEQEDDGTRLTASAPVTIDNVSYQLSFVIKSGRLYRVNLMNDSMKSVFDCDLAFNRAFALLKAKYGDPDTPPERKNFNNISVVNQAHFTFQDGSNIAVSSVTMTGECMTGAAYTAGNGGSSF